MPSVAPGCKREVHNLYCQALCSLLRTPDGGSILSEKTNTKYVLCTKFACMSAPWLCDLHKFEKKKGVEGLTEMAVSTLSLFSP